MTDERIWKIIQRRLGYTDKELKHAIIFLMTAGLLPALYFPAYCQETPRRVHEAQRLIQSPPEMNGRLDDACWEGSGWTSDFIQQQPHEGEPGSQKTEFKILYDDQYLYTAIRAHDNEPDKIDIRFSRRDNFAGDCVGMCFDSYFDKRTGYEFNLTASGTKVDLIQTDAGGLWSYDTNWNAVWDGKTEIGDSAWTAEMRIPFSQLRFAQKEDHTWGLHVWRWLNRAQEESQFQLIPLDSQGRVHRFGLLSGLIHIPSPRRVEIVPYVLGSLHSFKPEQGNPFTRSGRDWGQDAGVDGRIGLSGNFNLDFTLNPDFGQVEADPSVVNLTAFETFYEEKRPFFMEGRQMLEFSVDGQSLFYSRRIGRSPQYYPVTEDGEYADMPEQTTILGAAKVTGKTPGGWSVGILSGITARESAEIRTENVSRNVVTEPVSVYSVGRLQKDFSGGNHSLGLLLTSVQRRISQAHLQFLPEAAYTGGVDGTLQWGNRTYYINAKTVFSHVTGNHNAVLRMQESSVHGFGRIDADHLSIDSLKSSISGLGGDMEIGKGGNGHWRFEEKFSWRSPGLDLNDIGYIQQADQFGQSTRIAYVVNEPTPWFASHDWSVEQYNRWSYGREHLVAGGTIYGRWTFRNYWTFHGYIQREQNRLDTRLLRGGPAMRLPDVTYLHYHIYSDSRKRIDYDLALTHALYNDETSGHWTIWGNLNVRALDKLDFSISPQYIYYRDSWQYVSVKPGSGELPYLLAEIDQKTAMLTLRCNYYFTPDLSIQYYAQPFVSAGRYSRFKRVTDSKASRFSDRYQAIGDEEVQPDPETDDFKVDEDLDGISEFGIRHPDFNQRELHSNLVLRWEYKTGSTLYFVWTHGRSGRSSRGEYNLNDDIRSLFRIYPDNVFLVKASYWFSL